MKGRRSPRFIRLLQFIPVNCWRRYVARCWACRGWRGCGKNEG
jgi:hypothetical protein